MSSQDATPPQSPGKAPEQTQVSTNTTANAPEGNGNNGGGWLNRLSGRLEANDWANPILVREIRQSLRGRYFKSTFWITLVGAALVGLIVLSQAPNLAIEDRIGLSFFTAMFACLLGATCFFVPFSAFNSMGSEWEENTFDLLVISNLKPRQIVGGKILASLVQALLFYSAFVPFLIAAFLMRGVDLFGSAVAITGSIIVSVVLTSLAVCASSLVRARFARIAVMAGLSIVLIYAAIGTGFVGFGVASTPSVLQRPEGRIAVLSFIAISAVLVGLFFTTTAARLAHPEENRSSGVRLFTTAMVLAGLGLTAYGYVTFGRDSRFVVAAALSSMGAIIFPILVFINEPQRLGRRASKYIPANSLFSSVSVPFLPGGGRGVFLFLLLLLLIVAGSAAVLFSSPSSTFGLGTASTVIAMRPVSMDLAAICVTAALFWFYMAFPSGVLRNRLETERGRLLVRVLTLLFFALSTLLPNLVGMFLDDDDLMEGEHLGNPFWIISRFFVYDEPRAVTEYWWFVGGACVVAFLINMPRLLSGYSEVMQASQASRERKLRATQTKLAASTDSEVAPS